MQVYFKANKIEVIDESTGENYITLDAIEAKVQCLENGNTLKIRVSRPMGKLKNSLECTCIKPWPVDGICVLCHHLVKPYKSKI